MEIKYLLTQAKHKNGAFEKGVVVHDTADAARQGFHAYLGAFAYDHESGTDYVFVCVHDTNGAIVETPVIWEHTIENAVE